MLTKQGKKAQLNIRLPEAALKAIAAAAAEEGKAVADYVRIAALAAACHTRRNVPLTVFVDPREGVTADRADALGMVPVAVKGKDWDGQVRVAREACRNSISEAVCNCPRP